MASHPDFNGAGASEGIEIWRIEAMKPVPIPKEDYGKFYSGDSYIVLRTKAKGSALQWDIHFWLGNHTTADESGVAAYKTVELDDALGGAPVQHREVEEHESALFMSYFKDGIIYEEGGVESGFRAVDREAFTTRLLHVKGRRNVRVKSVPVTRDSLNDGDVFILDAGRKLYLWNGSAANRYEKVKGAQVLRKIKDEERGGRAEMFFLDDDPDNAEFWEALGGKGPIADESAGGDDAVAEHTGQPQLFKLEGSSTSKIETPGKLTKDMLTSGDIFIVDNETELFVWIGGDADSDAKKNSMVNATTFLIASGHPNYTTITRVVQGAETPVFKALFDHWDPPRLPTFFTTPPSNVAGPVEQKEIDISALHSRTHVETEIVDDGSGKLQIWRIEDFEKASLPEDKYGQFYGGDSYIIQYTYEKNRREEHILYFWQGNASTADERGASALLTKNLDDQLGGRATQVRVVQGKEPNHFCALFKGTMIVHSGGRASGFRNTTEEDTYDTDGVSLYHVKGTNPLNTRAFQVPEEAKYLNSGDCYVLVTPGTIFSWHGAGSSDEESKSSDAIATILQESRTLVILTEGSEPDEFWAPLGGKAEYPTSKELQDEPKEPRLFQCSTVTGAFTVEEIIDFSQEDLIDEDVMILDTFTEVYVWIGSQSTEQEKSMSAETAKRYVEHATDGRSPDTPIVFIHAGDEPAMFTCHFLGWDPELTQRNRFEDPYEARMRKLREEQDRARAAAEAEEAKDGSVITIDRLSVSSGSFADPSTTKVPYEQLKNYNGQDDATKAALNLDPSILPEYLNDEEFASLIGVSRADFAAQPKWRRDNKKKELGLF